MKLSEAIRLGAMMRPQAFLGDTSVTHGGSCALQAANEAAGNEIGSFNAVVRTFPILNKTLTCPVCREMHAMHWIIAMHLNDKYRWTRERIADWVATIEPQETAHDLQPEPNQDVLDMPHSQATVSGGMDK